MSWSIAELVNTVEISDKCAEDLYNAQAYEEEIWWDKDMVRTSEQNLYFDGDHDEHMDYLSHHEDIKGVLLKHKVEGDICFGSLEGDNAGDFWGYRFDGKGGMEPLEGKLEWYLSKE